MGPISFWGNVLSRALQRVVGTVSAPPAGGGPLSGALLPAPDAGLVLRHHVPVRLPGARQAPPCGLLIGITLGVIVGGVPGDIETALWRSGDVILGSVLALLFCSIYPSGLYPLASADARHPAAGRAALPHPPLPNVLERPKLTRSHARLLAKIVSLRPCWPWRSRRPALAARCSRRPRPPFATASAPWRCWPTPIGGIARATS